MNILPNNVRGLASRAIRHGQSFVCRGCYERQRRQFSHTRPRAAATAAAEAHPSAPPASLPKAGITQLTSRRLLSISGPDAAKFLQGVITANVVIAPDGTAPRRDGFYAAFLTAQGRILHDVFVYPDTVGVHGRGSDAAAAGPADSFLIEVDAAEAERLQKHIRRYKLRAKFEARLLDPGEWAVWHAWDDTGSGNSVGSALRDAGGLALVMPDTRAPNLGYRMLAPVDVEVGLERTTEDAYRVRRYLNGIAEGQEEILKEQALPHESNMDATGAIDFRKGCYVGQELTIRTQHRGVVRKRILPCLLYGEDQGLPEQLMYRPEIASEPGAFAANMVPTETSIGRVGKKGRSAGKWIKGVGNVGLALCRLEIMTDVVLPGETAATAYSPDNEFTMRVGLGEGEEGQDQAVKIKAFVPDWLRHHLTKEPSH